MLHISANTNPPFCHVHHRHDLVFAHPDDAVYDRLVVLPFSRIISEEMRDTELDQKLLSEKNVIFSLAIDTLVLEENKLVFLPEGGAIINRLVEIHKELIRCRNEHFLSDRSAAMLLVRLEEVSEQLYDVSEKLTDIHHQDEEEDDDVDC